MLIFCGATSSNVSLKVTKHALAIASIGIKSHVVLNLDRRIGFQRILVFLLVFCCKFCLLILHCTFIATICSNCDYMGSSSAVCLSVCLFVCLCVCVLWTRTLEVTNRFSILFSKWKIMLTPQYSPQKRRLYRKLFGRKSRKIGTLRCTLCPAVKLVSNGS